MKKVLLSAFVAVLAIGASEFTSANRFTTVYYQHANGLYYDYVLPGTCCYLERSGSPCSIEYGTNQSIPNGTAFGALPSGFVPIGDDGVYDICPPDGN